LENPLMQVSSERGTIQMVTTPHLLNLIIHPLRGTGGASDKCAPSY